MVIESLIEAYELIRAHKHIDAIKIYKNLFKITNQYWLAEAIGRAYIAIGEEHGDYDAYLQAVKWIEKAVELDSGNAELHYLIGFLHFLHVNDEQKALSAFRQSLSIYPDHEGSLGLAAALFWNPAQVVTLEEAIGWLERLVEIKPDQPWPLINLASLYKKAELLSDAEECWAKALTLHKDLALTISDIKSRIETLGN